MLHRMESMIFIDKLDNRVHSRMYMIKHFSNWKYIVPMEKRALLFQMNQWLMSKMPNENLKQELNFNWILWIHYSIWVAVE